MPTIKGSLNLVTDRPVDSISEVWVRARETRGQGDGLTVGVNDRVPVSDGALSFTALPGAAVLVLVQNGIPVETLPMLVGDEAQQSLRLVVQAGQVAGSADKSVIEQLAAEIAASVTLAEQYRTEAASSASKAKTSETAASKSASNAKTSETRAKTSETNAKTSETNAASSASASASSASSSKTQADKSAASETAAAGSAAAAKTSETKAASSASASASSASSASTQAGKSATSATQAGAARDAAKASETAAAGSAAAAKTSETNSKQSEDNAGDYAAVATTAATEAVDAMDAAALSAAAFSIYTGTGFPEGKVEAPVGSVYTDSAATNGAIRWIKTSGTGNTGWSVEYGDTGWRDIGASGDATWDFSGHIRYGISIRRIGERVILWMAGEYDISTGRHLFHAPEGFRHQVGKYGLTYSEVGTFSVGNNIYTIGAFANGRDYYITGKAPTSGKAIAEFTWTTDQPWPTTLPGTPA